MDWNNLLLMRDEASALQALIDSGHRYAAVINAQDLQLQVPLNLNHYPQCCAV
jgi:hypothetical protein